MGISAVYHPDQLTGDSVRVQMYLQNAFHDDRRTFQKHLSLGSLGRLPTSNSIHGMRMAGQQQVDATRQAGGSHA